MPSRGSANKLATLLGRSNRLPPGKGRRGAQNRELFIVANLNSRLGKAGRGESPAQSAAGSGMQLSANKCKFIHLGKGNQQHGDRLVPGSDLGSSES